MVSCAIVFSALAAFATVMFLRSLNGIVHTSAADINTLWEAVGLLMGLVICSYLAQILIFKSAFEYVGAVRMNLVSIVADAPLEHIETLGVEEIITILTRHIRALVSFIAFIPNAITSSMVIAGCAVYILSIDFSVGIMIGAGILVIFALGRYAAKSAEGITRQATHDEQHIRVLLRQLIEGAREIRLSTKRRMRFINDQIPETSSRVSELNVRTAKIFLRHSEFVRVSQLGFVLLILLYSGFVADLGVAGVGAIVIILFFLQGHVGLVNAGWQRAVPAWIAYKKISDVVEYLGKLSEQSDRVVPQPENWHEIEFRNATFRYPTLNKSEPAFSVGPLNMSISKGELIFITGLNGAGKTTISKIISGLYWLNAGSIILDGQNLDRSGILSYREYFCVLFADKYLFDELCPPHGEISKPEIHRLIDTMKLTDKVDVKDGRFTTLSLSMGQQDRLAMIDAIVQKKRIMIFDEWAANQDPMFRQYFYNELLPHFKENNQTTIVISHDDRYYDRADKLWNINEGKLTEVS